MHRYNTRFQAKQLQAKKTTVPTVCHMVYRTFYQTRSHTDYIIRDTIQTLQNRCITMNCVERIDALIALVHYLQRCTSFFKRNEKLHDALNCFIERFLEEEIPSSMQFHLNVNGHPTCEDKLFELEEMIETLQYMLNK